MARIGSGARPNASTRVGSIASNASRAADVRSERIRPDRQDLDALGGGVGIGEPGLGEIGDERLRPGREPRPSLDPSVP